MMDIFAFLDDPQGALKVRAAEEVVPDLAKRYPKIIYFFQSDLPRDEDGYIKHSSEYGQGWFVEITYNTAQMANGSTTMTTRPRRYMALSTPSTKPWSG